MEKTLRIELREKAIARLRAIKHGTEFKLQSRTIQSHAHLSDVNDIVARYKASGGDVRILNARQSAPVYGDATQIPSFEEIQQRFVTAATSFDSLPQQVKDRFKTPSEFLAFMSGNPTPSDLLELGIAFKKEAPKETPTEGSGKP